METEMSLTESLLEHGRNMQMRVDQLKREIKQYGGEPDSGAEQLDAIRDREVIERKLKLSQYQSYVAYAMGDIPQFAYHPSNVGLAYTHEFRKLYQRASTAGRSVPLTDDGKDSRDQGDNWTDFPMPK